MKREVFIVTVLLVVVKILLPTAAQGQVFPQFDPRNVYSVSAQPQYHSQFTPNSAPEPQRLNLPVEEPADVPALIVEDFLPKEEGTEDLNDECNKDHNSQKSYSVGAAAQFLGGLLKKNANGMHARFQCDNPNSNYIPASARSVYDLSPTWKPKQHPLTKKFNEEYVQCVTFIFMVFEMAGDSITKIGRTHAFDFLDKKYTGEEGQFTKYQSGKSSEVPLVGDIVVWSKARSGTAYGHVAVVVESRENSEETTLYLEKKKLVEPRLKFGTIRVVNANSNNVVHEFKYIKNESNQGIVKIIGVKHGWATAPDYWLRKK